MLNEAYQPLFLPILTFISEPHDVPLMDVDTAAALISTMVAGISAAAAIYALKLTRRTTEEQIRAEHLSHNLQATIYCQTRYQEMERDRLLRRYDEGVSKSEIESFFRGYWTLKADQFDYWLGGYIDHDTFKDWVESTLRHFLDRPGNFFKSDFMTGWVYYGRPFHMRANPIFTKFHDALLIRTSQHPNDKSSNSRIILELMAEIDFQNLDVAGNSDKIIKSRRFGAPENIEVLLREIDDFYKGVGSVSYLFADILGDDYNIARHGEDLKAKYSPPTLTA